jgi:hypothetical protein
MMARVLRSPLPGFLLIALLWWLMVPALHINPRYLPSLGAVASDGLSVWRDLLASLWHTLAETVLGFLLGCLFGIGGGILFAASRWLERGLLPLFVALQSVPVIAFGAIVVIWCGNGLLSKVVIALPLLLLPDHREHAARAAGRGCCAHRAARKLRRLAAEDLSAPATANRAARHHDRPQSGHRAGACGRHRR